MSSPETTTRLHRLRAWRDRRALAAIEDGAKAFMGKPDAWFADPHWMCPNGHVSGMFLKCEEDGDCCLECHEPVILGPPIGEAALASIGWEREVA